MCIELTAPSRHAHNLYSCFFFSSRFVLPLPGGYSQGVPMPQGVPGGPPPVGSGYYPNLPGGPGPYPPYGSPPSREDSWGGRRGGGDRGRPREGRSRAHEEFKEANPGEFSGLGGIRQHFCYCTCTHTHTHIPQTHTHALLVYSIFVFIIICRRVGRSSKAQVAPSDGSHPTESGRQLQQDCFHIWRRQATRREEVCSSRRR